jgi:glycosyltransferase involved in cell wall biosynthesis
LVNDGHDVIIHAFDRLENLPESESIDGISIRRHRVGKTPYGGTLSTIMGLRKFRKSVQQTIGDVDLLHCHDADTLALSKVIAAPTLFDMHDLQHTWALMGNPKSLIRKFFSKRLMNQMLILAKDVDAIITSSPGFVKWLKARGLSSHSIENRPTNFGILPLPKHPTIGFFGKIREKTSFSLLRDALLEVQSPEIRPSVIIAGDGTHASDVAKIFEDTPEIISQIRGPFKETDLPSMMAEISFMYAMYSPERGNITDGALPAKMFEAAAFGRPSIVNKDTPMAQICESENLGTSVTWEDSGALATAIIQLVGTTVELTADESRERERFFSVFNQLKI